MTVRTDADPLAAFHPAVAEWFRRRFPDGPTEAQALGWTSIGADDDTLIAAPTGSGKTLAAFLVAIDRCLRTAPGADAERRTSVVYVSPLRALTVDVRENLLGPLAEIATIAGELGLAVPKVRVAVRNGDTTATERAAIIRDRPEILVTTPESLYLLATARRGRELLAGVETVIVDEIHAVARDKRGSHLALTLERLERLVVSAGGRRPTRIGCSATQRPIETIARLLVGSGPDRSTPDGAPRCRLVDVGHRRQLDVAIELGSDELGAVLSTEQLDDVVTSLAAHIEAHHTTLVFVNTRKMAERVAYLLAEQLGEDTVAAHHGSLSTKRRLSVEARLRSGELRAVVATASLELGIDVGPVDLVCQLGSPRAIATFLQRVGRAEHRRHGTPKGRLYPLSRDELVECLALLGAVHDGDLDVVVPPVAPLDILAQQIVAECAGAGDDGLAESELAALIAHAAPYAALAADDLESVIELVCEGVTTGRGVRGSHVRRDRVNGVLRARRGARLTATTSGGAIPELADYRVVVESDEAVVGTVHEDFAVEAMVGDVFLLGSQSWRVRHVEQGTVRVVDAAGAAPTIPFWLGEAPSRTDELASAVSRLRSLVDDAIGRGGVHAAVEDLSAWTHVCGRPAEEAVAYLATGRAELGGLPTKEQLIIERFFDDTGGMQLVVHCPYGARINRGFGLALRKRFCRSFDFELQAAASDDAVVLSLGPQHAFPLEDVVAYLSPNTVTEVLEQAVLATPIFTSRWRWNLSRSLVSPRYRGARHLPPAIQRMEADDLMAAIFPALAACQENVTGPIDLPDHPIVRQTMADCCSEAIDLSGLVALVAGLRDGTIAARCLDTTEPSVLTHEILNGRPYTFLDDAPLEERRTRAVSLRRGIPLEAHDLSLLDQAVIDEVRAEMTPTPGDAEELHDLLMNLVLVAPDPVLEAGFAVLAADGRAMHVELSSAARWCATERRAEVEALAASARFAPSWPLPEALAARRQPDAEEALRIAVAGQLEVAGPLDPAGLVEVIGAGSEGAVASALAELEARGQVMRLPDGRWWARRLIARCHGRQRNAARSRIEPVNAAQLMRFLLEWQHVAEGTRLRGVDGLAAVIDQLQGVEAPVGAWEESILPARVAGYSPQLLDELAAHGELAWGRLALRADDAEGRETRRSGATPSRATPVALVRREDLGWLLCAARLGAAPAEPGAGAAGEVLTALAAHGALFFADLCSITGRLPLEVADALWDGVACGALTSDGFQTVRALLAGRYRTPGNPVRRPGRLTRHRLRSAGSAAVPPALQGGRWSRLAGANPDDFVPDELAEAVAMQLLERWGVVFRDLARREVGALGWREMLWALRRLEARGVARGGRFVTGLVGEQFALPEAFDQLLHVAKRPPAGQIVRLSAADPLNLTGFVLPGVRLPARRGLELVLRDGIPEAGGEERPPVARRTAS